MHHSAPFFSVKNSWVKNAWKKNAWIVVATMLTTLLCPLTSVASANSPAISLRPTPPLFSQKSDFYHQQAIQKNLAQARGWLRLLYYPEPILTHQNALKSRIHNPNFFVSKTGNTDPQAELSATLTALFQQNQDNTSPSEAVRCRFPARVHWLMSQLDISPSDLPQLDCVALKNWERDFAPSAVSLVFVQEYLGNPASAFGHSLLRFEFPQNSANTRQATVLNYMPKIIQGESLFKSSYKSVIAGNMGEFTLEPYEKKIAKYRDQEGRDIWRYPLNLTAVEREQLARLIWEIKDQNLTYLLTKDNCASEILSLLNSLRPEQNYLADYHAIVAPADIVRSLQHQGMIIDEPIYEPSKKSKIQAQLNKALIKNLELYSISFPLSSDNDPLHAQSLSRISFGVGQQQHKAFGELGYRLVYHDGLDGQSGYPTGYYLEGLSAKIRYFTESFSAKNKLQLENLTLLKARSLNPVNTANNDASPNHSWGGQLSVERIITDTRHDGQTSHLVGNLGAEYGWSVAYGEPTANTTLPPPNICYALGTGDIQLGKGLAKANRLGVGAVIGCIQQFSPTWRATVETKPLYWYEAGREGKTGYWQSLATIGIQHDLTRQDSLRLTGQYQWQSKETVIKNTLPKVATTRTPEVSLQYLRYF